MAVGEWVAAAQETGAPIGGVPARKGGETKRHEGVIRLELLFWAEIRIIIQLNTKMNQMMAQMNVMLQMMQKNVVATPTPIEPINPTSNATPVNESVQHMPQNSRVQNTEEEGNEANQSAPQHTSQNLLDMHEPVTTAKLETMINERIILLVLFCHSFTLLLPSLVFISLFRHSLVLSLALYI